MPTLYNEVVMRDCIFIWRSENYDFLGFPVRCPWCGYLLRTKDFAFYHETTTDRLHECTLCGWYFKKYIRYSESQDRFTGFYHYSTLRKFDNQELPSSLANIESLLFNHLPSHSHWSQKKIDEILNEIQKNSEVSIAVIITALDGHGTILLLENQGQSYLIEIFKKDNSSAFGIRLVNSIVGIHLDWRRKKAYLVTENDPLFEPNIMEINFKKLKKYGYRMDFQLTSEIMLRLGIYNTRFPLLPELTESQRKEIIKNNEETEIKWPIQRNV